MMSSSSQLTCIVEDFLEQASDLLPVLAESPDLRMDARHIGVFAGAAHAINSKNLPLYPKGLVVVDANHEQSLRWNGRAGFRAVF